MTKFLHQEGVQLLQGQYIEPFDRPAMIPQSQSASGGGGAFAAAPGEIK